MGALLTECVLIGWHIVPFACAHEPDQAALRSRWLVYLIPLNVFAFRGAAFESAALQSAVGTLSLLGVIGITTLVVRHVRRRGARREPLLFEIPVDERLEVLNLSQALQ